MLVKDPSEILSDIRDVISSRAPMLRGGIRGKLQFLGPSLEVGSDLKHSPICWVLHAQLGTLDKIDGLFARKEGEYGAFELLAIARNLFENMVWLRLFNSEPQYGLIFYEQLLIQQKQNTENFIAKTEREIAIFEEYDKIDNENVVSFASLMKGQPSVEEIESARVEHHKQTEELDAQARRSFAIYAAAAKFNGYGYQCHLLRENEIPRQRAQLLEIQENLDRFRKAKSSILSAHLVGRSSARWNWKERATEVGMIDQYEFLYSYTSKLLHCTPMNLITEKQLSVSETLLMLDYAFVTILDAFDAVQSFKFQGQANVVVFDVEK